MEVLESLPPLNRETNFDFDEIKKILTAKLPDLKIKTFFITLFEPENKKMSRLFYEFDPENKFTQNNNNKAFLSNNLIPGNMNDMKDPFSLLALPLFRDGSIYGFILSDTGLKNRRIFKSLFSFISRAIKEAELIKKINEYEHILEANREKWQRGMIFYNHDQLTDITEIMKVRFTFFKESAEDRIIKYYPPGEKLYIKAAPCAVDRVIHDIMNNALQYTKAKGIIRIILTRKESQIILEIIDNGIGMTEEQLAGINEPNGPLSFKKQSFQDFDMGMFIVKKITADIGAEIITKSKKDKGSTLTITFPAFKPDLTETVRIKSNYTPPLVQYRTIGNIKEELISKDKRAILIVDRNVQILYLLQSHLKTKYNVFFSRSINEAINKLEFMPKPDLIISDILIDNMDGYEFINKLKENENYAHIPFIFLTDKTWGIEKIKALTLGAVDFISKPFSIEELKAKIDSIIQNLIANRKQIQNELSLSLLNILRKNKNDNCDYFKMLSVYEEYNLSSREQEVLNLANKGMLNKEIASTLNIAMRTVAFHLKSIYTKLNVRGRMELLNFIKKRI